MEVVKCQNPFDYSIWEPLPVVWHSRLQVIDLVEKSCLGDDVIVFRNGDLIIDLYQTVGVYDQITILPKVQGPLAPLIPVIASMAASAAVTSAAFTIGALTVLQTAALVGMATMVIGGLVMNMLMPQPGMPSAGDTSPSYGFSGGYNVRREGQPIPVHWGYCQIIPPIIGEYFTVDNLTSDMTYYGLYCISEGLTDQVISEADIKVNDEPLDSYTDYSIEVTDGDNSPTAGSLSKFDQVHQYRKLYKELLGSEIDTKSLLHFNGDDASTVITDEVGANTWTCAGTAALSTTDPFLGTACLDCPVAGDFISTSDAYIGWFSDFTFEMKVRISDLLDHGFYSESISISSVETAYFGVAHLTGGILQVGLYYVVDGVLDTTIYEIAEAATLNVDTWHHICIQQAGSILKLYLDGVLVNDCDRTSALPTGGTRVSRIGQARLSLAGVETTYDGLCKIDEFRTIYEQYIYDWTTFTPPVIELADSAFDVSQTITTRGPVDEVNVVIECPKGLYETDKEGIDSLTINLTLSHRVPGGAWTDTSILLKDDSSYPVRRQFPLTFASRKIREIKILRTTTNYNSSKKQGTTMWVGLDEIVDEYLLYPNSQCLALQIKATDQLSSIPSVKIVANRTQITVNGGTVDAKNPERVAEDIITNTLYGGGEAYSRIDSASATLWRNWCDGIITGAVKRATFNGVFDTEKSMAQALTHTCEVGRAHFVPHGTQIRWVIEQSTDPGDLYCARNVIPKTSKLHWIDITQKVDGHLIEYIDKDRNFVRQAAFHPSRTYDSLTRPANIARIFLLGINNYDEALRQAILRQQLTDDTLTDLEFQSGIKAMAVLPGDVIWYAHYGHDLLTSGGVRSVMGQVVKIDESITLDTATYGGIAKMWIQTLTDTILELTVSGPFDVETNEFTVVGDVSTVVEHDAYFIGRSTEERLKYRFSKVLRGNNSAVKMRCVEYNEDSYFYATLYGGVEI